KNGAPCSGRGVGCHSHDAISPRTEEKVTSLASDVGDGEYGATGQFLLNRSCVRKYLFRQRISIAIRARRESEVGVVGVISAQHLRRIYRPGDVAGQRAAGAVGIDWLHLILSLAGSIIIPRSEAEYRLVVKFLRRPRDSKARPEVLLGGVIPR